MGDRTNRIDHCTGLSPKGLGLHGVLKAQPSQRFVDLFVCLPESLRLVVQPS
jgi:hypothetical protein